MKKKFKNRNMKNNDNVNHEVDDIKDSKVNAADESEVETVDVIADEESAEIEAEAEVIDKQLDELNQLNKQLEDAKQQVEKEKKEYLYLMAEFDNFRKRTIKEKADMIKSASEKALKDLLPIVDDFERAIDANSRVDDAAAIKEGTELIYNKLIKYLASHDVTPISSTGEPFDADTAEAIAMVPVTDDEMKGKVIDTVTKGYKIGDKVLRHAKVAVGQ